MALVGIIGPSAVGKSELVAHLVANSSIALTPTWTTRAPRPGELLHPDHVFVSDSAFDTMQAAGGFVEVVQPFGLSARYGLPQIRASGTRVALVMLRAPLVSLLRRHHPHAVVYQVEDTWERAESRLRQRADEGDPLGTRLSHWTAERDLGRRCADRIFSNGGSVYELGQTVLLALQHDCGRALG
jgi:guanylate kinase